MVRPARLALIARIVEALRRDHGRESAELRIRAELGQTGRIDLLIGDVAGELRAYLRAQAIVLWQAIQRARAAVKGATRPLPARRLTHAVKRLVGGAASARLDYVEFFDPETLAPVAAGRRGTHMALAVFIGKTRLIDNARL